MKGRDSNALSVLFPTRQTRYPPPYQETNQSPTNALLPKMPSPHHHQYISYRKELPKMKHIVFSALLSTIISILLLTGCGTTNPLSPSPPVPLSQPPLLAPPAPLAEDVIADLRSQIVDLQAEIRALKSQLNQATIDVVDINSATSTELQTLPGIGPVTAGKIICARLDMNGFSTIDDLLEVPGIGKITLENLRPLVVIGAVPDLETLTKEVPEDTQPNPSNPSNNLDPEGLININTSAATQLEVLPGIGPVKAQAIVDFRSTNGPFQTIEHLIKVKGIGPKTLAKFLHLITI